MTYRAIARKRWGRDAEWINGEGRWATLARCPSGEIDPCLTIELHPTEAHAIEALDRIDTTGCGGGCRGPRGHQLIDLAPRTNVGPDQQDTAHEIAHEHARRVAGVEP